jgi:hypothetical protein
MSRCCLPVVLTAITTCCAALPAQQAEPARQLRIGGVALQVLHEQEGAAAAGHTVVAIYERERGPFADQVQYLADLQARFRDKGIAFAVALPGEAAGRVAAGKPRLVVARSIEHLSAMGGHALLTGRNGEVRYDMRGVDGLVDVLDAVVAGTFDAADTTTSLGVVEHLVGSVADGGDFDQEVAHVLEKFPRSGRAHAAAVLNQWWCKGDPLAARQAVDRAIARLSNEAVPMSRFADLVLRGDRNDPLVAKKVAMAMAPVAAGAPDGTFTQLVHLRGMLRAGQDRLAGRIAALLPNKLGGQAEQQLIFAETLMEAAVPLPYRDVAERAIQNAEANGGNRKWVYAARHKLLKRCGEDEAAAKLMVEYRKKDVSSSGLNNDAWYTIIRPDSMGRFDTLALAQGEEMLRVEGDAIDFGSKDTVALAMFVNGRIDRAIELQTAAAKGAQNDPVYLGRLNRYRATRKLLAELEKAGR